MHGCANACIVYGFNLGTRNLKFDADWLDENYPGVDLYAHDIVRNYLGEPVYGFSCDSDIYTGVISKPSEEQKQMIQNLFHKYMEYMKQNDENTDKIKLGYHVVVYGWDEEVHKEITL